CARADATGRTAQVGRDRGVPDEVQLLDLAHRDAHVSPDVMPRFRARVAVHVRPRVATACTTVICRLSAPASTSSTRAEPWPSPVPSASAVARTGPTRPNPR